MDYQSFRVQTKNLPLIRREYLSLAFPHQKGLGVQLKRWQNAGRLIKLRKGLYILNEDDRKINPSRLFIAQELYSPSYVSMEYALAAYGFIPERATDITCITSKKTAVFQNTLGKFIYQHLKPACFTGFVVSEDEAGLKYFMATPEKAVIDFLYLNQSRFKDNYPSVLSESFRFQNTHTLNKQLLTQYAGLFHSPKLRRIVEALSRLK